MDKQLVQHITKENFTALLKMAVDKIFTEHISPAEESISDLDTRVRAIEGGTLLTVSVIDGRPYLVVEEE